MSKGNVIDFRHVTSAVVASAPKAPHVRELVGDHCGNAHLPRHAHGGLVTCHVVSSGYDVVPGEVLIVILQVPFGRVF